MRKPKFAHLVLLSFIFFAAAPCFAVDKALVGLWQTSVTKADGVWEIRWDIQMGGGFHCTMKGPHGSIDDSGQLNAENGKWSKWSKTGSDSGSYTVMGNDKFSMVGALGPSSWTRIGAFTPSTAPGSTAAVPRYSHYPASITAAASNPYTPNTTTTAVTTPVAISNQSAAYVAPYASQPIAQTTNTPAANTQATNANSSEHRGRSRFNNFFRQVAPVVMGAPSPNNTGNNGGNNTPVMTPNTPGYGTSYYPKAWAGNPNWRPPNANSGPAPVPANVAGADAKSLLLDQFPLPAGGDEAEQFGLPGLARAAGSGQRRRQYRSVM